ncbi:MAG TPA: putative metal-binding motif-containing protein, partial [Nannocystaceae bacterium]|nr:putative metal-binding motif-containing protein [Nannocystaceae bacterium]
MMKRGYDGLWIGLLASSSFGCPDGSKGTVVVDVDGDGFEDGIDCDDNDPSVNPGAFESCGDGIDNDCDGIELVCVVDDDGDGFVAEDDCDDTDANVYPGAPESCTDGVDNDCDGISTTCLEPTMIYDATITGLADSYASAVTANRVAFGDPSGGTFASVGDGRVEFFELTEGTVSELDADFASAGVPGAQGAYGIIIVPIDGYLCLSADYHDYDANTPDAGKSWCFADATVEAATTSLDLASAAFTTGGQATEAFARTLGQAQIDDDGLLDLAVATADGVHVIAGNGTPFSGDYLVPDDADVTLGDCAASPSYWCGYGVAMSPRGIAVSGAGGPGDEVSLYELPLPPGPPTPTATYPIHREESDSIGWIDSYDAFAIGTSSGEAVAFVDIDGNELGILDGSGIPTFGYWVDHMFDQDGHELLLVGAYGATFDSTPVGEAFVFDVTTNGLPSSATQAVYRLESPSGFTNCGQRVRGGIVVDEGGVNTVVASACFASGGAAYVLDNRPLPAPLVGPTDIGSTA